MTPFSRTMRFVLLLCMSLATGACPGSQKGQSTPVIASEEQSLYVRLGGIESLRLMVDEWLLEITSDELIREFFVDTEITTLKSRILEKVCVLADGPCLYKGQGMYEAHSGMGLQDSHLRRFLVGLEAAMKRVELPQEPAAELLERVRGVAAQIAVPSSVVPSSVVPPTPQ